jgi:S-adenosylmethionine synthetase
MRDNDVSWCELAHTGGGLFQRRNVVRAARSGEFAARRGGSKVVAAAMLPRDCLGESQIIRCG